ncbi:hypothetical protein ATCC90586_003468 [Pythium insidiosum]|nr:hypothetical protein ATCC90586_003468 [Pythium insidiosum]
MSTISSRDASSDDDASVQEEKWDDLAIVRAFEDALTDKRAKAQHASRRQQTTTKPKSKPARVKADRKRSTASDAVPQDQSTVQHGTFASQEDLYQAAYAQAYAHLQQQQQQQQQQHHQQIPQAPSGYPPFGHYGVPPAMPAHPTYPSPPWQPAPTPSWTPPTGMPGMWTSPSAAPGSSNDDLASLLLAWYQSGYYTGRYQAMQEMKGNTHPQHFR